jgi:DNA polymerase-1
MTDTARKPNAPDVSRISHKPKLVIIDGYGLLFRAYLTPGPYFATSDGRPTGAVRGFTNMLLTLLNQEKPDALYVAWDAPGKTFRDDKFDQYKAHRPDVSDDLRKQFPVVRQMVEAFGIASMETPGFEADDLIGTLASAAVKEGYEVTIVTGDSDQLQLVGDGVHVRMTRTGVTDMELFDAERVREKYGVGPEQIADFKALVGDTSDNIPGVPGIGKVTAAKLLQQWGTMDNLIAHVDDLPTGKIRDNLANNIEQARLSLELATIHCEVPLEGPVRRYDPTAADWQRVREMFADLEFKTLASRLPSYAPISPPYEGGAGAGEPAGSFEVEVAVIRSAEELESAIRACSDAGVLAIRVETDRVGPTRATLQGIAFAPSPHRAWFVPTTPILPPSSPPTLSPGLFGDEEEDAPFAAPPAAFRSVLSDEKVARLGYNAKVEDIVLTRHGAPVGPFAFDAQIAAYVLNPGRTSYSLADLAEEHLNVRLEVADAFSEEERLAREAALAVALREPMEQRIEAAGLTEIMQRIEMPLIPILADMERVGVPVDKEWLGKLSREMGEKIEGLAKRIYELAGEEFTIGSTQQLQRILFEKLQLPTGKKIKTGFSTRADLLESLASQYEIAQRILEYRELTKLKSTYADALPKLINPETGRIHTSLNQTVAATGRLSSSDPNLQNIPIRSEVGREIRKAFVAPKGQTLLSCDYSQIELRVFAHVTKDPELLRAFAADEDIHATTASKVFGVPLDLVTPEMRRRAKTVNFAVIYGQSDFGLANTLGIPTAEAKEFIDAYFALFPGVREYTERTLEDARRNGYVKTPLGRRRYVPEIHSGNFNIRQGAERAAVNMPIQGAAADIMKLAMIDVFRHLRQVCYNCTLLLQVHDELVFGVDEDALPVVTPEIVRLMENAYAMDVPIRVDAKAGRNWAEMTPVKVK